MLASTPPPTQTLWGQHKTVPRSGHPYQVTQAGAEVREQEGGFQNLRDIKEEAGKRPEVNPNPDGWGRI